MIIVESGQILKNSDISAQHSNVFGLLRLLRACKRIRYDYYRDPTPQRFLGACKQDHCEVFQPKRSQAKNSLTLVQGKIPPMRFSFDSSAKIVAFGGK